MTIEEFIEARLTADEAAAKAAQHGGTGNWVASGAEVYAVGVELSSAHRCDQHDPGVPNECDDTLIADVDEDHLKVAEHIAGHNPARELRQVAALQAIAGRRAGEHRERRPFGHCETCRDYDNHREYNPVPWPCPTVRAVASIWADHSDFRPEWIA